MGVDASYLKEHIRDVPDFPQPGILFRDITPLLADVDAFRLTLDCMADRFSGRSLDLIAGIEARGFLFAAPLAYRMGAGLVPVRKAGKLPKPVASHQYDLEYGTDTLEVRADHFTASQRILIVDDVLATGGTAAATATLLEGCGLEVAGFLFLVELAGLDGRSKLAGHDIVSMVTYE